MQGVIGILEFVLARQVVSSNSSVSAGKLVRLIAGGSVRQECWGLTRAEVVELH